MDLVEQIVDFIKKQDQLQMIRKTTRFVVRYSVKGVVTSLVISYTPVANKKGKLMLTVGAWTIAGTVADVCAEWADKQITEAVEFFEKLKSFPTEIREGRKSH